MQKQSNTEREVRQKFWDLARKQYPDVGEPGTVWVLTEVLGYNWDMVCSISVDGKYTACLTFPTVFCTTL